MILLRLQLSVLIVALLVISMPSSRGAEEPAKKTLFLPKSPVAAAYVLARTRGVVGFFGASSMERLPTEVAMTENMKRFKAIPVEGA